MALPSCDAFICLFMSHGRENIIFGVDGAPVNIDKDILEPFDAKHCPALAGKPKLFFIQACQGGWLLRVNVTCVCVCFSVVIF